MDYKEVIYKAASVWYLRKTFISSEPSPQHSELKCVKQNNLSNQEYLKMYYAIGGQWNWSSRILMNSKELEELLGNSKHEIYYVYNEKEIIGYFEFDFSAKEAEIVYFGILPQFYSKGYGRKMMHLAFQQLITKGEASVFLHTCSKDSPAALPFYKKMGFTIYNETIEDQAIIIGLDI